MDDRDLWLRKRGKIVLIGFFLVAAFFLITEHTAHVLGVLPYLILLACPLMHIFMHHGHGAHQHGRDHSLPGGVPASTKERAEGEPL